MRPLLALTTVGLWLAATPSGWFPGAEFLIVPALAAFYVLITTSRRPFLTSYLVGFAHLLVLSWSVRHFAGVAIVGIGLVGGFYYSAVVLWVRVWGRWIPGALAFAVGVAFFNWLRTAQPELPYPHGQPAHCLFRWPVLMGPVAWGGEVLLNAWLAALAAALVDLFRSWRGARPSWRVARAVIVGVAIAGVLMMALSPPRGASPDAAPVRVAAIQPNLEAGFQFRRDRWQLLERTLMQPTRVIAGRRAARPPDLVLWPETGYTQLVDAAVEPPVLVGGRPPRLGLAANTRLVAGSIGRFADGRETPLAVVIDADERLQGMHEKIELVPLGEFIPFLRLLPKSVRDSIQGWLQQQYRALSGFGHGDYRPLLTTANGTRFGALLCYDNAFPGVARTHVARGARFIVVLSNETWYFRGAELAQLEAMTVCRALELATPIVRCTMDGSSVAIDSTGRAVARLPYGTGGRPEPEILEIEVDPGPGALPPLSWLHQLLAWLVGLSCVPVAWHTVRFRARLLRGRPGRAESPARARSVP